MLEFRFIEHFNRNYNTIARGTGKWITIATSPVFTELLRGAEVH